MPATQPRGRLPAQGFPARGLSPGRRLSRDERLVQWHKPAEPAWTVSHDLWAQLPEVLTLRLVRCRLSLPGFRTREVILVTTLLDREVFPPAKLAELYYRRWFMELSLRNLKITLQMDQLSCKTPANLEREIRMYFLMHRCAASTSVRSS